MDGFSKFKNLKTMQNQENVVTFNDMLKICFEKMAISQKVQDISTESTKGSNSHFEEI